MARQDNLDIHFVGTRHRCVKAVNLKPQQHAVAGWPGFGITYGAVMMLHFPSVQLQHQAVADHQSLIFGTAVRTATPSRRRYQRLLVSTS